jgi:hypothetical protein
MRPIFSSDLPVTLVHTSRDDPVCPVCPETLVLDNSKIPMSALAQRKYRVMSGRSQKGYCLITMLYIHPCIQNDTLSLWNRTLGTVKVFSYFMVLQVRFSGDARLCRTPKKVICDVYLELLFPTTCITDLVFSTSNSPPTAPTCTTLPS